MQEPIKFFNLQKNNKKDDKQPDYRISFREGDTFYDAGACWIKKDKKGNSFLSCKLADKWVDHTDSTKTRKGFHITEDTPLKAPETPEIDQGDEEIGF